MEKQELGRRAVEIGLDLTPAQGEELARATALAGGRADLVPRHLPVAGLSPMPRTMPIRRPVRPSRQSAT